MDLKFWKRKPEQPLEDMNTLGKIDFPNENLGLDPNINNMNNPPDSIQMQNPLANQFPPNDFKANNQDFTQNQGTFYRETPNMSPQNGPPSSSKDFELLNAKLDYIKAELDSIKQRIIKIEKIADQETHSGPAKKKYNWY